MNAVVESLRDLMNVNFDGKFQYEYKNGEVYVVAVWDRNGDPIFPSDALLLELRHYAAVCVLTWLDTPSRRMYNGGPI